MNKELWYELASDTPASTLAAVCNLPYAVLVISPELLPRLESFSLPQRMSTALICEDATELDAWLNRAVLREKLAYLFVRTLEEVELLHGKTSAAVGLWTSVDDRSSLERAAEVAARGGVVMVQFADPTNIPLELVLAKAQQRGTKVMKRVTSAEDGEVSLLTMERGSDGIVLRSDELDEIQRLAAVVERNERVGYSLEPATITAIRHVGMGDRVCVDTTSELFENEGMLLGSTSSGGLFVCSETHYLPYMNLRPFRVNAGALHMYAWAPDQRAVYLSDLRAGDQVLAFDFEGRGRAVTVGRVKIERRPLLLLEASIRDASINVFIQDDWHVRMASSRGEVRPSSELRPGDQLLGFADQPGRHVGLKIHETITER